MSLTSRLFTGSTDQNPEYLEIRDRILQYISVGMTLLGTIAYFNILNRSIAEKAWITLALYSLLYAWVLLATFLPRLPYAVRGYSLLLLLFLYSVAELTNTGLAGSGIFLLLVFVVLTGVVMGIRSGYAALGLSVTAVAVIGSLMVTGIHPLPNVSIIEQSGNAISWFAIALVFILLSFMILATLSLILNNLNSTLAAQKSLSAELELERSKLEERVQLRTKELERRASQLDVASQIAREIAQETSLDQLLETTVNLIRDRFGFYHAGIFLVDTDTNYAVLKAATGEAGQKMLDAGHQLKVGAEGIVGYVTANNKPRIALDVGEDSVHFRNPILPYTRSEMAVPLRSGAQVIGALDVQSVEESAFSQADVDVIQTIADQLAAALSKAQLVEALQRNVADLEAGFQLYTQQTWRTHLRSYKRQTAFQNRHGKVTPIGVSDSNFAYEAIHGKTTIAAAGKATDGTPLTRLSVPIILRDEVLGVIEFLVKGASVSSEVQSTVEMAVARIALALENARLLEEIRDRAEREHVVSEISTRVRTSTDVEQILRTTAVELGRSLGTDEVRIQLRTEERK